VSLYKVIQYIKYRWKAQGRHGTHSPFVYAFIEDLLIKSKSGDALINDIKRYFQFEEILECTKVQEGVLTFAPVAVGNIVEGNNPKYATLTGFSRLYIFREVASSKPLLEDLILKMRPEDVLLIMPLYTARDHMMQWEVIKNNKKVKLSIDLFDMGLLFFREEFKEKQAFVLKY
jgi:hypothetical protein